MAFIFVPNADGGFNEGDRQTNPETGIEYIYIDGAWRALGPDISDEFPELDTRYVKKAGDTMTGGLMLGNSRNLTFKKADGSNQFAINPNVNSDYFTNIYTFNSVDGNGGVRFRVSQDQGVGSSSYDMLVALSGDKQEIGGVEYRGMLSLNRVRTPEDPDQAANKWYVDNAVGDVDLSGYLPLTGGELTGDLDMNNANIEMLGSRIDFYNDAGEKTMEIAKSGFIKSADMIRVVRGDGGPILEGRTTNSASDIKVKIDSDGYFMFRDRGELYGDIYLKDNKKYIAQGAARNNVAQFYARTDNIARLENSMNGKTIEIKGVADPTEPRDAVNLQYLQGLPFATEDYVDTATEHDLTDDGLQDLEPNSWTVKQKNQDGNNRTFINIYDGSMHLYNVADPTNGADGWAVNKKYVDDLFTSSGGGSYLPLIGGDLTGRINITMSDPGSAAIRTIGSINVKSDNQQINGNNNFIAHKDYVRVYSTPVGANDVTHKGFTDSTYRKKTSIPGLIFAFESGGTGTVSTGKFRWYNDGGRRLKINSTTKDGIPWGVDSPTGDINFSEGHMFTIYTTVTGTNNWRIKQTGTINRIDWHSNDILCYVSYHKENGSFSTSAEYGIVISGIF